MHTTYGNSNIIGRVKFYTHYVLYNFNSWRDGSLNVTVHLPYVILYIVWFTYKLRLTCTGKSAVLPRNNRLKIISFLIVRMDLNKYTKSQVQKRFSDIVILTKSSIFYIIITIECTYKLIMFTIFSILWVI